MLEEAIFSLRRTDVIVFFCLVFFALFNNLVIEAQANVLSPEWIAKTGRGAEAASVENSNRSLTFGSSELIQGNNASLVDATFSTASLFYRYYIPPQQVSAVSHLMTSRNAIRLKGGGVLLTLGANKTLNHPRLRSGNYEGGARSTYFVKLAPPVSPGAHVYRAVYDLTRVTRSDLRQALKWSWAYLERGSNIKFEEFNPQRPVPLYTRLVETGGGCWSTIGVGGEMHMGPECGTPSVVLHEVLHSLGLIHEHQRPDRNEYLDIVPSALSSSFGDALKLNLYAEAVTEYDYASIMHYGDTIPGVGKIFSVRKPEYRRVAVGTRISLSSCDWTTLNTMYPGKRKPFPCHPHEVHQFLFPAAGVLLPDGVCLYENSPYFIKNLCVSKDKKSYPDFMPTLKEELGFDPLTKAKTLSANKRAKKKRRKPAVYAGSAGSADSEKTPREPETSTSRPNPETEDDTPLRPRGPPKQNTTTEVGTVQKEQHKPNSRSRRYEGFTPDNCAYLISLKPNVLNDGQCRTACSKGCSKNFPGKSLQECMSVGYYICIPPSVFNSSGLRLACSTLTILLLPLLWHFV